MELPEARRVVIRAVASAKKPSGMWDGDPLVRLRCSTSQRETLVEVAQEFGFKGPLGTYIDPVDFWHTRDMLLYAEDQNEILVRIIFTEGDHSGPPVLEGQPEPRLLTALRNEL